MKGCGISIDWQSCGRHFFQTETGCLGGQYGLFCIVKQAVPECKTLRSIPCFVPFSRRRLSFLGNRNFDWEIHGIVKKNCNRVSGLALVVLGHCHAGRHRWAGQTKRGGTSWHIPFSSRYLAESNCSTRFCRPLPNRSVKVPFSIDGCKGTAFISNRQIISLLFLHFALIVSANCKGRIKMLVAGAECRIKYVPLQGNGQVRQAKAQAAGCGTGLFHAR